MKKITFLFFTIALISFTTSAQDLKVKFSAQGGLNYSSLRGYDSFTDDNPGFSYLFGFSFQHEIQENLSVRIDLNYERKTQISKSTIEVFDSSLPFPSGIYKVKTTSYLNYIVLPIMLKYNFSNDKSFYVNGGPYLGYLLKSGIKSETDLPEYYIGDDYENTKDRKSLDFGLSAGIGKEFKLNENHNIYIELRENLGLANIAKGELMNGGSIKTNSLNLLAGFTF